MRTFGNISANAGHAEDPRSDAEHGQTLGVGLRRTGLLDDDGGHLHDGRAVGPKHRPFVHDEAEVLFKPGEDVRAARVSPDVYADPLCAIATDTYAVSDLSRWRVLAEGLRGKLEIQGG